MKRIRQLLPAAAVIALVWVCAPARAQGLGQADTNTNKPSGTVTDSAGNPIAGAKVEYWHYEEGIMDLLQQEPLETNKQAAVTDAEGAFSFDVSSSPGEVLAQKPGFAPAWRGLSQMTISASNTVGKLVLTPPGILAGTVMDESNRPVAGAEVYVETAFVKLSLNNGAISLDTLPGRAARNLFSARTDAAGRFRIQNFPTNARASLAVQSPGRILRPPERESGDIDTMGYGSGQEDLKLVIEPAGSIEGKLLNAEDNRPLPACQLRLQPDEPRGFVPESIMAKSNTNGLFHFDTVLAGSYRIQAFFGANQDADWVAEPVSVTVASGQTTRDVQVKAVHGALLEVIARDQSGKPLSKVNITAYSEDLQSQGLSDTNGVARMHVLPGEYRVAAFGQRSQMFGQTSAKVEAGKTNRVEIELGARSPGIMDSTPAKKIFGVVLSPDGQPAAGISVQMVPGYPRRGEDLKTDANGKFELEWSPQQIGSMDNTACLLVRDAEHNLAVAQELDEDTTNLVLKLAPGLTLAGRVESAGKPITNVTARLVFWTGRSGHWLQGLARTNTPGQYEIPALPPGRRYGVVVSAPGYGQRQNHNLEISAEPGRQELDPVELRPANLRLAGQVLDADDKPVARCYINLSGGDQPNDNARTDSKGRFTFAHVCEGTVQLSANSQRSYGSVSAEGGDTNVVLRLGQRMNYSSGTAVHKIRGVVTDADGKPASGVQVAVFPNESARWVKTGTNGDYSLNWSLQPWQAQSGSALLVFRDKTRNLAGAEELSEEITNLDVKLKPALVVSGQVKNSDGAPLAAAQITFHIKAGSSFNSLDEQSAIPVNAEGRFEIKCLPPDAQYLVAVSAKGFGKHQQQIRPDYESNRVELETFVLKNAGRVIAGQVLRNDDQPASGVQVQLSGEDQPEGNMTTDSRGRFHFQVCDGPISLLAYSQGGSGSASVRPEAGDTNIVIHLGSSSGRAAEAPRPASLKGKHLPDLAPLGLTATDVPASQSMIVLLIDAEQRPSRRTLKLLADQADALKAKHVAVLILQAGSMADAAYATWLQDAALPFPIARLKDTSEKGRAAWGVAALPWLVLANSAHQVVAEGVSPDELEAQLQMLTK